jgi:hypothetical protein
LNIAVSNIVGTLPISQGGTGQTGFGQGWLASDGSSLSASTSPTVAYVTATSTTATSTLPLANITTALRLGADYLTDITGSGLNITAKALAVANPLTSPITFFSLMGKVTYKNLFHGSSVTPGNGVKITAQSFGSFANTSVMTNPDRSFRQVYIEMQHLILHHN